MVLIQRFILGALVAVLVFNLTQRRHLEHGEKKRFASLGIAGIFLLIYAGSIVIIRFALYPALMMVPVLIAALLAFRFRSSLFVFAFHCSQCSAPLPIRRTLYYDQNLCGSCIPDTSKEGPQTVEEIDWDSWVPDQRAVLCFVIDGDSVLLINKKTGLGAGKVNAPGGRIEQGESPAEAAVRECREEVDITPSEVQKRADLSFQFTDGLGLHCSAFFAYAHEGTASETDEADPFWCAIDGIPFDRMWEDDAIWLPIALKGSKVSGRFIFDGDSMISREIREVESFDAPAQE